MKLNPGLVGGHCIGVDPYYLLHKSKKTGYVPDLIKTAREINDSMASFFAGDMIKQLIKKEINPLDIEVAVLGFAFKEDCSDIRNTKVYDLINALNDLNIRTKIYDPEVNKEEVKHFYNLDIENNLNNLNEKIAFLAVQHKEILQFIS